MGTAYHGKYIAHDLTRLAPAGAEDGLSMALFDAAVDLNPHQIEAAMFALQSPLAEGAILADEVGLGKTIEAGIVLCQKWAERKRKLIIICPAAIRQQWAAELTTKFNLPAVVVDAKTFRQMKIDGLPAPLSQKRVVILSYHYAARLQDEIRAIDWDLVVIDEAHKLRNAYRTSNRIGQALQRAVAGRRKLLLTATPLQNSLMEIFGLTNFIDPKIFGDANSFRAKYANAGGDLPELRKRLAEFCKRTLRKQVLEYVRYTRRKAITQPFTPAPPEQALYDGITRLLQKEGASYAIPNQQRHLTVLILRKLLASSSEAIAGTLEALKVRLVAILAQQPVGDDLLESLSLDAELSDALVEEWEDIGDDEEAPKATVNLATVRKEIDEIDQLIQLARSIPTDTKSKALITALEIGFAEQERMAAQKKALIFTESRRTQAYLQRFLEAHGPAGNVVIFNGTNADRASQEIYARWSADPANRERLSGSRAIDMRAALIDEFRDRAAIMIATEAAAEGVNLQFCSQVINYDLPWNPQRIEQRIGRCHRYGQTHDVIVVNFLNEANEADKRVHSLLTEKFNLFDGLFGASDEVLGALESGVDFEKRILAIYQDCRTPEAIAEAFDALQSQLDEQIRNRMEDTRRALIEHFDEDVHARLKMRLASAREQLDRIGQKFWDLTRVVLVGRADFDDVNLSFDLIDPPAPFIRRGRYHLISRQAADPERAARDAFLYRLSHPLGESVIATAKATPTPVAELRFNVTQHPTRLTIVEALKGRRGWLTLRKLTVNSFEIEEYLLFSGIDDSGRSIDPETCEKLFSLRANVVLAPDPVSAVADRLHAEADQHVKAALNQAIEANNQHFAKARNRLERWAEDKIFAAEKALKDTKEHIKAVRREAGHVTTLEEEASVQLKLQELERRQRKQRQEIFAREDEVAEKRDALIASLQKRLQRGHKIETLFTLRWAAV